MVNLSPRGTTWVLIFLFVSLALNLFVAGVVVAHKLHPHPHGFGEWQQRGDNEPPMRAFVDRLAGKLPPDDRTKFLALVGDYRAELGTAGQALRLARGKVRDALAADPFDRNALESALGDVRARMQDMQKVMHAAVVDAATQLSPEARKSLSNWGEHKDQGPGDAGREGGPAKDFGPGKDGGPDKDQSK